MDLGIAVSKRWWQSKTVWANFVALLAAILQEFGTGWAIDPEYFAAIVAVVNLVLRKLTGQPISVTKPEDPGVPKVPRRERRRLARDLAASVTNQANLLVAVVAAGLLACGALGCAGAQINCPAPTIVLRDASTPELTRLVFMCGEVEIAAQDVDLKALAGVDLCDSPSLRLEPGGTGKTRVVVSCAGIELAEFLLDTGEHVQLTDTGIVMKARSTLIVPGCRVQADSPDAEGGDAR